MKVKIICVGKLKEKYLLDAVNEYAKRLNRFCTFSIIELGDEKIPDNASDSIEKQIMKTEAEKIQKHIGDDEYVFSLCVEGTQLSSEEFSSKMSSVMLGGKSTITFVIGGSLGLDESIKKRSDFRISFSKMTFPHQLMRVFLTEQIYRSFKISANEKYHK